MKSEKNTQSIASKKQELIEKILKTENCELLDFLSEIVSLSDDSELYQLSESEKIGVEKGLEDFKNGRVMSHEEAMKSVQMALERSIPEADQGQFDSPENVVEENKDWINNADNQN